MKTTTLAAIALLPMAAFCQTGDFSIHGKIGQLGAPAKAYLYYETDTRFFFDSTLLQRGMFLFKGKIERPVRGYVIVDEKGAGARNAGAGNRVNLYVEPGVIKMESPDSVPHVQITGTPLNADYAQIKTALKPVTDKLASLQKTDTTRKALLQQRDDIMVQFIRDHPGSLVSFDVLKEYGGLIPDPVKVEPVYNYLSASLKADKVVAAYDTLLQGLKKTAIGQPAPDFTQADTAGHNVSLHDFKGKYVLIDFWASWCKPCRHENPAVVKAFNAYKDQGFTILSVSLDAPDAKDKWIKAIHDDGLTGWTHVSDLNFWSNAVAQLYQIRSIPQNFLLDKEGKIIAKNLRGEELAIKLQEVFGSNN